MTERPNWDKLARACRRYLDAFNDEIADDIALGSVGNDLKIVVTRELPSAATQTAEQAPQDELTPLTEVLPQQATDDELADYAFVEDLSRVDPPSQSPHDAPNTPTSSVDTGTPKQDDSGQLKAELADALDVALDRNRMNQDAIQGWDYDEDLGPIADALLAAGWRPPLPKWEQDLNDGIGIDNTQRVYTEADLVDAYAQTMNRERDGQTVEWGRRFPDGRVEFMGTERASAEDAVRPGTEVVYRLVHPWKVDED